jgi:hypothetical protein
MWCDRLAVKSFRKVLDKVSIDTVHSYCHFCLMNTTLVQLALFETEASRCH